MNTSKIIKGVVGGGRYTVTAPIVKEDYGLYLKIEGLELPSTYEVDFSNSEHNGTSVTMIGNSDGVLIPRQFIDSGKDVFAFLYHVGDNYGRTVFKFRIPNKLRPDRTNQTPTPEEQSTIDQAISALNSAVEQTAQDVIDADASAQSASDDADRAEEAKTDAQNFATQAEQSATSASQSASQASASATASANSASQSAQIKDDVESMVDDAQASASASAQSATASANSASQASASATSASQSATSAQGYASQAQTSAQAASSKASEASGYASTASTKASESAQSATNASQSAQTAEQAKTASQTAQGLAESARDSAISAQESAEDARDEAQSIVDGISGKVEQIDSNTERIESLEDDRYKPYAVDTASGSIASFPDGADDIPLKSLAVDIDPVQNLNGYDSPWVGGGGKNKCFLNAETITKPSWYGGGWLGVSLNSYNGITQTRGYLEGSAGGFVVSGLSAGDWTISFDYDSSQKFVYCGVYYTMDGTVNNELKSPSSQMYFSGSRAYMTVSIPQNQGVIFRPTYRSMTDAYDLNNIQVESGSTATSYVPYENICPISGWTGMQLKAMGKNLFNKNSYLSYRGYFDSSEIVSNVGHLIVYIRCMPNTTYTVSRQRTVTNERFAVAWTKVVPSSHVTIYDKKSSTNAGTVGDWMSLTITTGEDAKYLAVWAWWNSSVNPEDTLQIELSDTRTDYEPYQGTTLPISWQTEAGTVYGGTLDVVSGVLIVTRYGFDGGDVVWNKNADYNYGKFFTMTSPVAKYFTSEPTVISSSYASASNKSAKTTGKYVWIRSMSTGSKQLRVKDDNYDDATTEEFRTAMTGVQFVYELAEPIEIQLTPQQVNSLLGVNNIWADSGDTEVEYRADTKLYIERLTEPDADMIADSNITSGKYFMVGNSLYLATANIASGGQVIVGTNATRKSLAQALNEINA